MHRSDWLLLFLATAPERPVDPVRLQKGLFLLAIEALVPAAERYSFEPYLYGPMSRDLYRDLRSLREERLVQEATPETHRWRPLLATPAGLEAAAALEAQTRQERPLALKRLGAIRRELDRLSFEELLRRVYERYPEYATRSVFRR